MPPRRPGSVCSADAPRGRVVPDGFSWMVMQRHGRRPLAIMGRTLIRGDNRCAGLPWWSSVTIHETDTARLATALCHAAGHGPPWRDAWLCNDALELRDTLGRHDPLAALPWPILEGTEAAAAPADPAFARPSLAGPPMIAAWQFRAAWAGLLGALLGLTPSVDADRAAVTAT